MRKIFAFSLFICLFGIAFGSVPGTMIHDVNLPDFYQPISFYPLPERVFSLLSMGMIPNKFSDVSLNPAFMLDYEGSSVYFEIYRDNQSDNSQNSVYTIPSTYLYNTYPSNDFFLLPPWENYTVVQKVDTNPLFQLGIYKKISPGIALSLRTAPYFYYGPYRTNIYWREGIYNDLFYDVSMNSDLLPDRLEVDENQQKFYGFQAITDGAFRINRFIVLSARLGYKHLNRDGNLTEDSFNNNPHNSSANMNRERLNISGKQFEAGGGFIIGSREKGRLGGFVSLITGSADEDKNSLDTLKSWYEDASDPEYYYQYQHRSNYETNLGNSGKTRHFLVLFEKPINGGWRWRSFVSRYNQSRDIDGSYSTSDTTFLDRTYDYWDNNLEAYFFRREISHSSGYSLLKGSGNLKNDRWELCSSVFLEKEKDWVFFAGIRFVNSTMEYHLKEDGDGSSHSYTEYSYYQPGNVRTTESFTKQYDYRYLKEVKTIFIPSGIKMDVSQQFKLLLGTDLQLTLTHTEVRGERLYPSIIYRYKENGQLVQEDIQENRYELFTEKPADVLSKSVEARIGAIYRHPSGLNLYILSAGDIFQTMNWQIGFEMSW